ncbi:10949_t:CDS:1, partial [Dentiscutata heterogama]
MWSSLLELLKPILPKNYSYLVKRFNVLLSFKTAENFTIPQYGLDAFVNISTKKNASEMFIAFESWLKTTMPKIKLKE